MMIRALSGAVYVALIVACVLAGQAWFFGLCLVFALLAVGELETLLSSRASLPGAARLVDLLGVAAMFGVVWIPCTYFGANNYAAIQVMFAASVVMLVVYVPLRMCIAVADREGTNPARGAMASMFALMYAAVPPLMLAVAYAFSSWRIVLLTLVMIWLNDTGAYLTGRSFGRTKLCERLSPKKTWEGFWGGFALCVIAGVAYVLIFLPHQSPWMAVGFGVYGAAVSGASTVGDLFESLFKRTLGVKDSGNLIPGHGGILDRIDSLLAVAPLALIFVFCLNLF